jgi:hypothetical protein
MRSEVWLAEEVDIAEACLVAIGVSREAAVRAVQGRYPQPPYKVTWEDTGTVLRGHFERVLNYSIEHRKTIEFSRWKVFE